MNPESLSIYGSKKVLNFIYIVDTSVAMRSCGRMEKLNRTIREMVQSLRKLQLEMLSEIEVKITIIQVDDTARVIVEPTPVTDYEFFDLAASIRRADYGNIFRLLNEKMSRSAFFAHKGRIAQPYIIFILGSAPADESCCQAELDALNDNGWYCVSYRVAALIDEDAFISEQIRNFAEKIASTIDDIQPLESVAVNAFTVRRIGGHPRPEHQHDTEYSFDKNQPDTKALFTLEDFTEDVFGDTSLFI